MIRARTINQQHGFTLIELLLSMSFVSVLLISIAMLVIQIGNIYNKGLTIKEVNQAGRSLSIELQSNIAQSPQFSVIANTGGHYAIQKDVADKVVGGRLCFGGNSYIWNDGTTLKDDGNPPNKYEAPNSADTIRFIKVVDSGADHCIDTPIGSGNYPSVKKTEAIELLNTGELNLAVYNFSITSNDIVSDDRTEQRLYNISFLLGTDVKAIDSNVMGCLVPTESLSDINFCAVNQFSFVARAGNVIK